MKRNLIYIVFAVIMFILVTDEQQVNRFNYIDEVEGRSLYRDNVLSNEKEVIMESEYTYDFSDQWDIILLQFMEEHR
ncbi:hypothetical protein [Breznakia pachnodae]|uniref:Uncharacterized protein n=1 Tax=Breznakia pachnodae TaxID=265178 RepID=A0ABU0DZZ3_9FIRM|nr:hypothetical protein [Breznakia pachnodae]MDQ0359855.1 hypothetical protein [Breznakia pachnodae]